MFVAVQSAIKTSKLAETSMMPKEIRPQSNNNEHNPIGKNRGLTPNSFLDKKPRSPNTDKDVTHHQVKSHVTVKQNKIANHLGGIKLPGFTNVRKLNSNERVLSQQATQMLLQYKSSRSLFPSEKLPSSTSTSTTHQPKKVHSTSVYRPAITISNPLLVRPNKPNVVDQSKYINYKEYHNTQQQQAIKQSSTQPDDDCILLDEENNVRFFGCYFIVNFMAKLYNSKAMHDKPAAIKPAITAVQAMQFNTVLKRLPSGILVKETKASGTKVKDSRVPAITVVSVTCFCSEQSMQT